MFYVSSPTNCTATQFTLDSFAIFSEMIENQDLGITHLLAL